MTAAAEDGERESAYSFCIWLAGLRRPDTRTRKTPSRAPTAAETAAVL